MPFKTLASQFGLKTVSPKDREGWFAVTNRELARHLGLIHDNIGFPLHLDLMRRPASLATADKVVQSIEQTGPKYWVFIQDSDLAVADIDGLVRVATDGPQTATDDIYVVPACYSWILWISADLDDISFFPLASLPQTIETSSVFRARGPLHDRLFARLREEDPVAMLDVLVEQADRDEVWQSGGDSSSIGIWRRKDVPLRDFRTWCRRLASIEWGIDQILNAIHIMTSYPHRIITDPDLLSHCTTIDAKAVRIVNPGPPRANTAISRTPDGRIVLLGDNVRPTTRLRLGAGQGLLLENGRLVGVYREH